MKELSIMFEDLPPMPTNRAKTLVVIRKRPMYIKTPLAREFEKDVLNRLEKDRTPIMEFVSSFDKKLHFIKAEYVLFTPEDILFTKNGCVSNRAGDLDAHKLFQDTLFSFMGLDDKLIRDVRYHSLVSRTDKHDIKIIFKLESLCKLKDASLMQNTTEQQSQDLTWSVLL